MLLLFHTLGEAFVLVARETVFLRSFRDLIISLVSKAANNLHAFLTLSFVVFCELKLHDHVCLHTVIQIKQYNVDIAKTYGFT